MAESISEGTLSTFTKKVGDFVEADEQVASIETDKIDVSVNASDSGVVTELLVKEGDTVIVGQQIAKIDSDAQTLSNAEPLASSQPSSTAQLEPKTLTQPATNQITPGAQDKSAAHAQKPPDNNAAERNNGYAEQVFEPHNESLPEDLVEKFPRGEHRVKMNRMRLRIAERLKQSQNTAAFLTTFNEVDMSGIMELRARYKEDILKTHGVRLGFMGAFAKAAALALQEIPAVNAYIEGPNTGDTIVYRDYVDVSVAVSTSKGLVTPVVRNCESLSIIEIEREIARLAQVARDGKMTVEDLAGGSFTISNGGVFGSMMGTPIINMPQTAVLGLHAIKDRAVVVDGKITIKPMMYLALTYDHRLLDGSESVKFLVAIRDYMQDPSKMLLA